MRGSLVFLFLVFGVFLNPGVVFGWDQHHFITLQTIKGFENREPWLAAQLNVPVEVHPVEAFIKKAFGAGCSAAGYRDGVLDGVGRDYSIHYTRGASYRSALDWERGNMFFTYTFTPSFEEWIRPSEILSVYSDEPDWQMDDDVARLKDKGQLAGLQGAGTRALRHFWWEGENILGTDMGRDQELDRRMQLLYEMALIAFSVDEPYWGYRFLANSLHYLQDLTQPFHVKAAISYDMVFSIDITRAAICDEIIRKTNVSGAKLPENCVPHALENAEIRSGWLTGVYHGMYEDFAKALASTALYNSQGYIADRDRLFERHEAVEPIELRYDLSGLLNLTATVRDAQKKILEFSDRVGNEIYETFGNSYRYNPQQVRDEILRGGRAEALGYRIAVASFYDVPMTNRQRQAKEGLLKDTNSLFSRAGTWGRSYLKQALLPKSALALKTIEELRQKFKQRCVVY